MWVEELNTRLKTKLRVYVQQPNTAYAVEELEGYDVVVVTYDKVRYEHAALELTRGKFKTK